MLGLFPKSLSRFFSEKPNVYAVPLFQSSTAVFISLLLLFSSSALFGQQIPASEQVTLIKSMGLPRVWKPYFTPMLVRDQWGSSGSLAGELNVGLYKDFMNPVTSLIGMAAEGYIRKSTDQLDGGVRCFASSKFLFTQGGLDYSFHQNKINFLMSLMISLRRGGLFKNGDNLRIDWCPGRANSLSLGLSMPLAQPYLGKTRPKSTKVPLPKALPTRKSSYTPDPELRQTLSELQRAAYWIDRFTFLFLESTSWSGKSDTATFIDMIKLFKSHIHQKDSLYPEGHTFEAEVNVYHRELERAFYLAALKTMVSRADTNAEWIAQRAREILLDEVIFPYDRLLGQRKKPDSVRGLGSRASQSFEAWVKASPDISADDYQAIGYVFQVLIDGLEQSRSFSRGYWGDSRLVWIPLHYALRFEDHATQKQVDALIQKATGQQFVDGNDVHYVVNELFQPELERMIHQAEDYHVLWIHDYRGTNAVGEPDEISYRQTMAYLQTLTDKVREYEKTRKIPVYMLFLDEHYYEINHGRLWLKFLQAPLQRQIHLPAKFREWEKALGQTQEELRSAVAQSAALQADAKLYGDKWLKNQIKVHVSITNPSDLSFRSPGFFKFFPFFPDNLMRDHRKITFYDVTELDPGKGEAMYTGMGIGEHYVGPTWDDRSVLVRGPVLVSLKDSARELLLSQGFAENDIPALLRPLPKPSNYDELVQKLRAQGWNGIAMQVHNATGFGQKNANLVKACLYELMPKGSHMYVPCSLWNCPVWGAMLVGAALRGCIVLVVTPSFENAPSDGLAQMSRANELFTRFVIVQNYLGPEIESAGGIFKVGIYSMDVDVGDQIGKIKALNNGIAHSEVFQRIFPFAPNVVKMVAELPQFLESQGIKASYLTDDATKRKPKLHLKSQFFSTEKVINTATPLEAWEPVVQKYVLIRARQSAGRASGTYVDAKGLRAELAQDVATLIEAWRQKVPEKEREVAFPYLTVGSHNEDYRSMIMDGDDLVVVGDFWAMVAYLDFVSLMAQTTWVNDVQQLEHLLPKQTGFWQHIGRFLRIAL